MKPMKVQDILPVGHDLWWNLFGLCFCYISILINDVWTMNGKLCGLLIWSISSINCGTRTICYEDCKSRFVLKAHFFIVMRFVAVNYHAPMRKFTDVLRCLLHQMWRFIKSSVNVTSLMFCSDNNLGGCWRSAQTANHQW